MRVAFFSPLNPIPSGISDYAQELLPYLARYVEIELIVEGYVPTNPATSVFPRRSLAEFYARAASYDVILYQMGNSPAHAKIYETLLNYPGVVVMHDIVLHHLRAWLSLDRGKRQEYLELVRQSYPNNRQDAAENFERDPLTDRFEMPLNQDVVRAARGLIVHSAYASGQIQPLAPNTPLAVIPMGISLSPLLESEQARRALSLPPGAFLVGAFGEIHPYKRVLPALAAFCQFSARHPNALFLFIGRETPLFDVMGAARELNIQDSVRMVGYVPHDTYQHYIAAMDVCLNLRYPTAGETSASLLRLLAAGKVTFVTRAAAAAELPDDVCVKIEPDAFEQTLLEVYLEFFAQHPDAGARIGAAARLYIQNHHTLDAAALAYAEFLRQFQHPSRDPLYSVP